MDSKQLFNNDALKGIDMQKIMLLQEMFGNSKGKSTNEMLPILMAASKNANSKGLNFTKDEVKLVVDVLKKDMSKEEIAKTTKMLSILGL
ncbi:MAG: hypothetical protein ACERKZ_19280 [Lachnotalea sp.]